jgi:hypothetical protein
VKVPLKAPTAVAVDSQNQVYILEPETNSVRIFTLEGEYIRSLEGEGESIGQFRHPSDIAIDENDNLYVADAGNYRIQVFNRRGGFFVAFGSIGFGRAEFQEVSSLAVTEGKVFVADYKDDDIKVFKLFPDGVSKVNRVYATRSASPPENATVNEVLKYAIARDNAYQKALEELGSSLQMSPGYVQKFARVESYEILNDGQLKVTLSAASDIPPEVKADVKGNKQKNRSSKRKNRKPENP